MISRLAAGWFPGCPPSPAPPTARGNLPLRGQSHPPAPPIPIKDRRTSSPGSWILPCPLSSGQPQDSFHMAEFDAPEVALDVLDRPPDKPPGHGPRHLPEALRAQQYGSASLARWSPASRPISWSQYSPRPGPAWPYEPGPGGPGSDPVRAPAAARAGCGCVLTRVRCSNLRARQCCARGDIVRFPHGPRPAAGARSLLP